MAKKKKSKGLVDRGREALGSLRGSKQSAAPVADLPRLSRLLQPSTSEADTVLERALQVLGESAERAELKSSKGAVGELHERIRRFGTAIAGDESRKLRGAVLEDLGNIARTAVRNKVPLNRVGVYVGAGIAESLGENAVKNGLFQRLQSLGEKLPGIGAKAISKPSMASRVVSSFSKGGKGRIAAGIGAALAVPSVIDRVFGNDNNEETIRRALASADEPVPTGNGASRVMQLLSGADPAFEELMMADPKSAMQLIQAYTPQSPQPAQLPRGTIALSGK